jgi:hypothetical protein
MSSSKSVVIDYNEWDVSKIKYMAPKPNDRGLSTVSIISTQTNRALCISTPMMKTWGAADYVDPTTGESDGKYSLSLNFPNPEYETPEASLFLEKFKQFENKILEDAVKNSMAWWKSAKPREIVEFMYFPSLKYPKNKETGQVDHTKAPSLRPKIPFYSNKWSIEIYDVNNNLLFPSETASGMTPCDFIQRLSSVACVLQCGGIWLGAKGWGVSFKCIQCVVKPQEMQQVLGSGHCFIKLSAEEIGSQKSAAPAVCDAVSATLEEDEDEPAPAPVKKVVKSAAATAASAVIVDDSDTDEPAPAPVLAPEPPAPVIPPLAVPEVAEEVAAAEPEVPAAPVIKKKTVIKKK